MDLGTYADGRALVYDAATGEFAVGHAAVPVSHVRAWARCGLITWADSSYQEWFERSFPVSGDTGQGGALADGGAVASTETRRGKLFGYRSKRLWKMGVATLYYGVCGLALLGVFGASQYASNARDVAVDKVLYLMVCCIMLLPAFVFSDFAYRDKLPLFRRRKWLPNVVGLALCVLLAGVSVGAADSLHSEGYKVARAERVAAEEAAAAKAAEDAAAAKAAEDAAAAKAAEDAAAAKAAEEAAAAAKAAEEAAAAKAAEDAAAAKAPSTATYIANSNTGKFHYSYCRYVGQMNPEHKVPYSSRAACIADGYIPCKVCCP